MSHHLQKTRFKNNVPLKTKQIALRMKFVSYFPTYSDVSFKMGHLVYIYIVTPAHEPIGQGRNKLRTSNFIANYLRTFRIS